ncbi:panB [Symbiodinium natans]|uniref:PanB protein n=1 Tax=Symbiodinium natans TaxID=878477 RepID=A0A812NY44_9DINO|nr:panB [Symbiodinium natans]
MQVLAKQGTMLGTVQTRPRASSRDLAPLVAALLTQLSEELERLEGENQRLHELLGIPAVYGMDLVFCLKQEKPEHLEGVALETWTAWLEKVQRTLQTFRWIQLTKLVGGISLIVWVFACFLVFVLAFMTLTEDATWVSIGALMAGVVMCAIAPTVFLCLVCCETSAKDNLNQLCSELATEKPGLSVRVDEKAWMGGRRRESQKYIVISKRDPVGGQDFGDDPELGNNQEA